MHTEAVTAPDGTIYVSDSSSLSSIQIAAHEAVHFHQKNNTAEYTEFESTVSENVLWGSETYCLVSKMIFNGHHRAKYEKKVKRVLTEDEVNYIIKSPKYRKSFLIEFTAYANEAISANSTESIELFSKVFSDWDAVVEASKKFNEAIGLDFSGTDTDTTAAPGENSDSPSLSDSAPTGITELSAADKKKDVFQRAAEDVLGYKELSEEQKAIRDIGRQLGWKVEFGPVRTPKGSKADGKISFATKTITIDPTSKKPIQFILKHELAHSLEQNKEAYTELQNAIMDSQAFKDYVKAQGFASTSAYNADIVARYKAEGVEGFDNARAEYKANCEMVANFVGDCLFGGNTEVTARLLEGMNTTQRRSFIQWVQDFFAKLRDKLSGKHKQLSDEISKLENAFLKTLNSVETKENTVTEDGESYAINHFEISDIDTESNMQELAKMDSVYNVKSEKLEKTGKKPSELFSDFFDSLGNSIYVEQFGDIALSKSSVKSEIRHGITAEKIASIEAIPTVLKQGKIIFAERKSGSDVDRIVVCAPIEIGDTPYYMGVMLQRDTQNQRLYLHNVIIERETPNTSQADLLTTGALEENEHLSMTNILQKALSVKNKYMQESEDYSISAPSRVEDVLESYKNGEISVEEADKLLYNKSSDNSDTHYGEHIHHTPSDYKPASDREWQVFCRSFANQTNGMKDGEYRAVSIFTADAHYLISADGYMSGVIVDKVSIDEYEERKEFYDNITRADVSNFRNEENGSGQRNHSNSDIASQNEEADSFDVELDAFIESHPEWFANKRKTRSNYSRSIKSAETDESFSISEKTDIDSVLEGVSRGEISTQEVKALSSRRKTLNPAEIVCHRDGSLDNFYLRMYNAF